MRRSRYLSSTEPCRCSASQRLRARSTRRPSLAVAHGSGSWTRSSSACLLDVNGSTTSIAADRLRAAAACRPLQRGAGLARAAVTSRPGGRGSSGHLDHASVHLLPPRPPTRSIWAVLMVGDARRLIPLARTPPLASAAVTWHPGAGRWSVAIIQRARRQRYLTGTGTYSEGLLGRVADRPVRSDRAWQRRRTASHRRHGRQHAGRRDSARSSRRRCSSSTTASITGSLAARRPPCGASARSRHVPRDRQPARRTRELADVADARGVADAVEHDRRTMAMATRPNGAWLVGMLRPGRVQGHNDRPPGRSARWPLGGKLAAATATGRRPPRRILPHASTGSCAGLELRSRCGTLRPTRDRLVRRILLPAHRASAPARGRRAAVVRTRRRSTSRRAAVLLRRSTSASLDAPHARG